MAISTSKRKEIYSLPLHEVEEHAAEQEEHRPLKRMRRNSSSVQFKTDVSVKEVPRKETYDKNALWYQDNTEKQKTKRPLNENIQKLLDAVLDEQIDQWAAGVNIPERIANASKQYSSAYQAKALKAGILDRVAALESK